MHTFLKTLHVVAAVFVIGPLVLAPMSGLRALRLADITALKNSARQTLMFGLLSLIVFILGVAVVPTEKKDYDFSTAWVTISMTLYVVAVAIVLGLLVPSLNKAVTLLTAGTAEDTENRSRLDAVRGRVAATSGVVALLFVVIAVLMVWQPFGH